MFFKHADRAPTRPTDVPRHSHRGRDEVGPSDDAARTLRNMGRNLETLTHSIQMATIDDLPVGMQRHVVGLPRTWVRLLWRLANVVVFYDRAHWSQA
jgi:hypothetical protein